MRILVCSLVILFSGCVTNPESYEFADWGDVGYDGFVNSIDTVAGAGAQNCGFFNLILDEGRAKAGSEGIKCARQAYNEGTPFKFGTVRIPTDSYAYEVLVRSSAGDNWLIVYDIIVDGTDPQIWFKKCESIKFRSSNLAYEGQNCAEYDGLNDPVWNDS